MSIAILIRKEEIILIRRHRGNRRYTTFVKAKRKAKIVHEMNDYWHYKYFGQYRKGKIHCSCPLCAAKTNNQINKSRGPLSQNRRLSRLSVTNSRYGKKNYKISERRKIDKMDCEAFIDI